MYPQPRHTHGSCASARCVTLAFLYLPLLVIALYAFNPRRTQTLADPGAAR